MNTYESYILNKILEDKSYATRFLKEEITFFCGTMLQVHYGVYSLIQKNIHITFMSLINESNLQKHDLEAIGKVKQIDVPVEKAELDDFDYCMYKIKEEYKLNQMKSIAQRILDGKYKADDGSSLITKVMEEMSGLSNRDSQIEEISADELMDFTASWQNDTAEGLSVPSYKMDLKDFNKTTGGLQFGDFVLLKGFTGAGKTALALHIAKNLSYEQKIPTLYFNMEMSKKQIGGRLLTAMTKSDEINWQNMLEQDVYRNQSLVREMEEARAEFSKSEMKLITINFPTLMQVESLIREYKQRFGTKVFFIDYLQRIQLPDNGKKDEWQKLLETAKRLKTIAKSLDVIIITLVQVKKDGTTAGASYVDWEADLAFWIRKPEEDDLEEFEKDYKMAEITRIIEFTKQRMGAENAKVPVNFYGKKFQFFDTTKI